MLMLIRIAILPWYTQGQLRLALIAGMMLQYRE